MKYSLLRAAVESLSLWATHYVIPRWIPVLVALFGAYDQQQLQRTVQLSQKVEMGASEAEVLLTLGQPTARFDKRGELASALFGKVPRKWVYGPRINFANFFLPEEPFLNPIPLELRLWTPNDGDLVIEWDDKNTVTRVMRPKRSTP